MKWLMFLLLFLNFALATFGWLDLRKGARQAVYSSPLGMREIELLGGGRVLDVSPAGLCWLIGPLVVEQRASTIYRRFLDVGFDAQVIVDEVDKAPGYWVYYGPIASYPESLQQLKEFQSKGIDSFIIGRDGLKGSISLGVFENIDSARRMKKIMLAKGYETDLYEIAKKKKRFWVRADVSAMIEDKALFDSVLGAENKAPEKRQVFCN